MKPTPITDEDAAIVALIGEGLPRWAIAERLGLSESSVRRIVRRLCAEYGCSMRDLPECVKQAQ